MKHPWIPLADAFTAAALGTQGWRPALAALAAATGSRASPLIALDANGEVALNLFTGLDPRIHDDYLARGREDPDVNPRVRAAVSGALAKALRSAGVGWACGIALNAGKGRPSRSSANWP